ncbi:hypothetical protein D9M68_850260 [compost metagenome]
MDAEITGQYTKYISIYHGPVFISRKGGNSSSRIFSDSFQPDQCLILMRELTSIYINYLLRSNQHVSSPGIIAKALPEFQHLIFSSRCKIINRRETIKESIKIGQTLFYTRLLENYF